MSYTQSIESSHRFNYLDGVRGWAAVIVLLGHTIGGVISLSTPSYNNKYIHFFTDGHLAVLTFFVLSGYVLTLSQVLSTKRNITLATTARYFRLTIPILGTTIIAYLFLKCGLFYNKEAATTPESLTWLGRFYIFDANFWKAINFSVYDVFFHYVEQKTYNSSLWTMPFELQGSFLIYAYIAIFRRTNKIAWTIPLLLTWYCLKNNPFLACFMFGYLLAEIKLIFPALKNKLIQFAMTLLLPIVIIIDTFSKTPSDRKQSLLALAIVLAASYAPLLNRAFSSKVSMFLGKISFPLYLIQIIIICSWSSFLRIKLLEVGLTPYMMANLILISTVAICIACAYFLSPIEAFSIKYSKVLARLLLLERQERSKSLDVASPR